MITIPKSVNFGPLKTGLSTVGYAVYNSDGSVLNSRSVVGVNEIGAGSGNYGIAMTIALTFSGFIIWDTGDSNPYYAIDELDARFYQGSGGGVAFMAKPQAKVLPPDWWVKGSKKMIRSLKDIIDGVTESKAHSTQLSEVMIKKIQADLKILMDRKIDLSEIQQAMKDLSESVSLLNKKEVDFSCIQKNIEKVKSLVEKQNVDVLAIVEGMTTLIESEQANLVKQGGSI